MSRTNKDKKILTRSGTAVAAMHRNSGGPMKHRLEPKAGAKNDQPEFLEEACYDAEHCGGIDCYLHPEDIRSPEHCSCKCSRCIEKINSEDDGTTDFIDKQLKRDG